MVKGLRIFGVVAVLSTMPMLLATNLSSAGTIVGLALMPIPFTPNGDGNRDTLHIKFQTAETGEFLIRIFNVVGEEVITLATSQTTSTSQSWDITWDGKDGLGRDAPSAVYFVLVDFNGTRQIAKAVLRR